VALKKVKDPRCSRKTWTRSLGVSELPFVM
jgi:hypothetical protein